MRISEEVKRAGGEIGKATGIALLFCMAAVLLFAFIVKVASLPSEAISPVNRVIKACGILLGCILSVRERRGWLKGLIAGGLSALLSFFLFSLIGGSFSFTPLLAADVLFGGIAGGIAGVISVNLARR